MTNTCTAMTPSESEEFNKLGIRNAKLYNAFKEYEQIVVMTAGKTYVPPAFAVKLLEKYKDI